MGHSVEQHGRHAAGCSRKCINIKTSGVQGGAHCGITRTSGGRLWHHTQRVENKAGVRGRGALWHRTDIGRRATAAAVWRRATAALAHQLGARLLVDLIDRLRPLHLPPRHPMVGTQVHRVLSTAPSPSLAPSCNGGNSNNDTYTSAFFTVVTCRSSLSSANDPQLPTPDFTEYYNIYQSISYVSAGPQVQHW